nr:hypothetical protein SYMBAF_50247 [Serratia symbiotica]
MHCGFVTPLNWATAMFWIKTLFGDYLSMWDYDAQVGEVMVMIKALHRMTLLGGPPRITAFAMAERYPFPDLFNKATILLRWGG